LEFRLFPDMLNMRRQVQIASDTAKGVVAGPAGIEIPAYEDNEHSVADLQARLAKTVAFVQSVWSAAQIDGTEAKDICGRSAATRKPTTRACSSCWVTPAQHLFPLVHDLRHPAATPWRRDWQARLLGQPLSQG
jgi:hypothetical protein